MRGMIPQCLAGRGGIMRLLMPTLVALWIKSSTSGEVLGLPNVGAGRKVGVSVFVVPTAQWINSTEAYGYRTGT
jgi:hypothetical protein